MNSFGLARLLKAYGYRMTHGDEEDREAAIVEFACAVARRVREDWYRPILEALRSAGDAPEPREVLEAYQDAEEEDGLVEAIRASAGGEGAAKLTPMASPGTPATWLDEGGGAHD